MYVDRHPFRVLVGIAVLASALAADAACMEVIAHRGASGYLPEHTLPAYALGYGLGAHWIEPDLVLTADDVPIALHDSTLERTTDVATVYPDRRRDDGRYYARDFAYVEIARLRVVEPRPNRYPHATFHVPRLEDVLQLVHGLNRTTGRNVGVYPELKHPELQPDLADVVVAVLSRYDVPVRLQSFDAHVLAKLATDHPRVQLVRNATQTEDGGLDQIATYAAGIGVSSFALTDDATLVARAHERGLLVHVFTLRADDERRGRFADEVIGLAAQGVDGVFTDHPDQVLAALESMPGCAR
ncbi:MAG: glycerophosphodiester phosphodiesterase family protein [Gammaproteobacteria bacterium]|nr:glycerophosphodiester phosphodiesterase family protein [Gammaproteobacteria bacterium]